MNATKPETRAATTRAIKKVLTENGHEFQLRTRYHSDYKQVLTPNLEEVAETLKSIPWLDFVGINPKHNWIDVW